MQDLDAAVTLGISDEAYNSNVDISNVEKYSIEEGVFRPYVPSQNVRRAFAENADKIGMANPYETAADAIDNIYEQLATIPLNAAEFPNIENPLVPMDLGTTLPNIGAETLNAPGIDANLVTNQAGNFNYYQMTDAQKLAHIEKYFPQG